MLKSMYRKLILKIHPDNPNADRHVFQKIFETFKALQKTLLSRKTFSAAEVHSAREDLSILGFDLKCSCGAQASNSRVNPECSYTTKYIFYDVETTQNTGIHNSNCVVAHYYDGTAHIFQLAKNFAGDLSRVNIGIIQ